MNPDNISEAVQAARRAFQKNEPIGLPTETVYGLAAPINSEEALEKIFLYKERPFFDPLIVHCFDETQARTLAAEWNEIHEILAKKLWPGPLTMVVPKNEEKVHSLITSGLNTVGLRVPQHELALAILRDYGIPLAAPSANKFGRTSPTQAEHVRSEFAGMSLVVVDGGPCCVGIESTILEVVGSRVKILRPGLISSSMIDEILRKEKVCFEWITQETKVKSPGNFKHHYMPQVPFILVRDKDVNLQDLAQSYTQFRRQLPSIDDGVKMPPLKDIKKIVPLKLSENPIFAAREFYTALRDAEKNGADLIYFVLKAHHSSEPWSGLIDRMQKAAIFRY